MYVSYQDDNDVSLRIQVCPKKGIHPDSILLWGWDWDHQSYSREGSGFLGYDCMMMYDYRLYDDTT